MSQYLGQNKYSSKHFTHMQNMSYTCWILMFLAALAALYLPLVCVVVVLTTLEFGHKYWFLRLNTLLTFDRSDELREKSLKIWEKKNGKIFRFFFIFFSLSPRSNVGRVSSLKNQYLCPNSKVVKTKTTKGRYRAARAVKNSYICISGFSDCSKSLKVP